MLRVLALLALLCSCDTLYSAAVEGEADYGTVYVCATGQGCPGGTDEYCWAGSIDELEQLLGADCHRVGFGERVWPALVGCAYCCGEGCGKGANAHCGSVCP